MVCKKSNSPIYFTEEIKMLMNKISNIGFQAFWSTFYKMGRHAMTLQPHSRNLIIKGMFRSLLPVPITPIKNGRDLSRLVHPVYKPCPVRSCPQCSKS